MTTAGVTRTYKIYRMNQQKGYLAHQGCISVSTSILASGFGQNHSPADVHNGSASSPYSEKYALEQMGYKMTDKLVKPYYGLAGISVRLSAQILSDMGIPATPVYKFTVSSAEADIRQHLQTGNPVLIKCYRHKYQGRLITTSHHALLLLGLDKDGYPIVLDPAHGWINRASTSGNSLHYSLRTLIKEFMQSPTGNTNQPYVTNLNMAGGYIKVG